MIRSFTMFVLLLLASPLYAETSKIEIITISNRPASEMIRVIQPFLDRSDSVTARGYQLIIKATPEKIEQVRALIQQLDQRQHRLMISVVQGERLSHQALNAGADLNANISINNPSESSVRGAIYFNQNDRQLIGESTQQLQTIDGKPAYIQVGRDYPVAVTGYGYNRRYGVGTEYRQATTGFAVTPRLNGQSVLLEIAPWSDRMGRHGVVDTRSVVTTISARLGEWVEIGGVNTSDSGTGRGLLSLHESERHQRIKIFVKVDDLDAIGR